MGKAVRSRETGQRSREVLLQAGHGALDALAPAVGGESQALTDLTTRLVQDQHGDDIPYWDALSVEFERRRKSR